MKNCKKITILILTCIMLFGSTISVNASELMPMNGWCCPGAADTVIEEGWHVHDNSDWHQFKIIKCLACNKTKLVCYYYS